MSKNMLRAFATAGVLAMAATAAAQDELSKGDKKWMEEEVGAIITKQEIAMFQEIDKDDRKLFKELFWMRRDYDPRTQDNEYREGYEERIKIANENFKTRGRDGADSDMGKIFLLMGAPDEQQQGGTAGDDGLPEIPPSAERINEGITPSNPGAAGGQDDTMLWVYNPNPSLGIPDGLAIEFRRREPFGYRIANEDVIDEHLERVKERMVANRAISYSLDEDGRLREPDDKFDPNSPAKQVLSALRNTGETSSGIAFTASPSFFQASGDEIYVPIDFTISEGPTSDNVTFFYAVENADGFEAGQAEEPVQLTRDADGMWRYEYPVQLTPGMYTLYAGFLDSAAQIHGTQIVDLEVPKFLGDELTLSSILMFSDAERTGEVNGVPGSAFLLAGYHFRPKGDLVYDHSEQLSGVLNAYNYGIDGEETNLTIQVAFFKDGEKRGQTEDGPFMVQAPQMALTIFDVPLNIPNFKEPGDYTIEVTVTDHINNATVKEEIPIVIEED
jgi:GWxTD domain-containing protein